MARHILACAGMVAAIVLSGCSQDRTLLSFEGRSQNYSTLCQENPWLCVPVDGTIHDGTGDGTVAVVPDDPSPGADGIWLGNTVSARYCYANHNRFVNDQDQDWLDDNCEFELARAFAPVVSISQSDGCAGGEPYWAAAYFPDLYGFHWGEFVRIAYMPAYYDDCGTGGHEGDSEFMMVSVQYNPATQHWEVRDVFLSAHHGSLPPFGRDSWSDRDGVQYPTRHFGYPRVWIAQGKHANYVSQEACEWLLAGVKVDNCTGNQSLGRLRIYPNRNVGSQFLDLMPNGVPSENPSIRDISVKEYFYTRIYFRGWHAGAQGVTPYRDYLVSQYFNCFLYDGFNCYWGETGTPSYTTMTGDVDGPLTAQVSIPSTWTTFVTGGLLPYQAQWWRKYASEMNATPVGTSSSGSETFSAGSWSFAPDRCEDFTLYATITSADMQTWRTYDHPVHVGSCPPPPLTNTIAKDGYNYTAYPSGGYTPYQYLWEACALDCDGGGDGLLAPSAVGGVVPNLPVHGWQYEGNQQQLYWTSSGWQLRSTVTDGHSTQAVATYVTP